MTEFVDDNTLNALMAQLATPDLGFPVAYPMVPFSPTDGVAYIQVWPLMKAKLYHPGLGFYTDSILNLGICQIDAVMPDGQGLGPGMRLAELIANRFSLGTVLTAGTRKLEIKVVPQTSTAIKEGAWIRFPVSITYQVVT